MSTRIDESSRPEESKGSRPEDTAAFSPPEIVAATPSLYLYYRRDDGALRVGGSAGVLSRVLVIVGLPLAVFLIAVGASLGTGSNDSRPPAAVPALAVAAVAVQSAPAAGAAAGAPAGTAPAAAAPAIRESCGAIRGTAYLSQEERAWFMENCPAPTPVPGGLSAGSTQTRLAPPSAAASARVYGTSDRMVISRLGVNAPINVSPVSPDGVMGVPLGANDVVWYDFNGVRGFGGYPGQGGNAVFAGHVDYICCLAVFAPLRNIQQGDVIDYFTGEGGHFTYAVEWFGDFEDGTNWNSVFSFGGGAEVITLVTCNGTFDTVARNYDFRRVVRAVRVL